MPKSNEISEMRSLLATADAGMRKLAAMSVTSAAQKTAAVAETAEVAKVAEGVAAKLAQLGVGVASDIPYNASVLASGYLKSLRATDQALQYLSANGAKQASSPDMLGTPDGIGSGAGSKDKKPYMPVRC